jgi:hypothetical protein
MDATSFAEAAAARLLKREGMGAIWQLHEAAARAYGDGHHKAACSMIEIADAAERQWSAAQTAGDRLSPTAGA